MEVLVRFLIILASVGILAWAVMASLALPEKKKEELDTSYKYTAQAFLEAVSKYHEDFKTYPWTPNSSNLQTKPLSEMNDVILALEEKKYLNSGYENYSYLNELLLTQESPSTPLRVYICFAPKSKTFLFHAQDDGLKKDGSRGCTKDDCYACFSNNQ